MIVLDGQDEISKAINLLVDKETCRILTAEPTNKHKNKLINMLRIIMAKGGLGDIIYKRLHPNGTGPSRFYGLPKIHKKDSHIDPQYIASMQSLMGWLRSW